MASIGRCVFSVLSGTQEITTGLANFNFDFSMVKVTAPDEYKSIGQHLSKKRKSSAEDGSFHRTARKLGALFEGVLPEAPHLVRAYGLRASEIIENPQNNPAKSRQHGPLDDHVGLDGRAHWAAATSGPGALPVLLLACILARAWKSIEAISIWSELVSTRKTILQEQLNGPSVNINAVTASQLEISRDALAEWDGSARSWLAVADKAKSRQHIQLMLIIDSLEMPLSSHLRVYNSILEVWTDAMTAVDQLISGVPLRVQKPHVLVGLAAWHLFPDISILGNEQKLVKLNDHLVTSGGLLTIGMKSISPHITSGISWTLPLKDLRYYGRAKLTRGGINTTSSHVSFDMFLQVATGSMIGRWGPHAKNFRSVAAFLVAFGRKASTPEPEPDSSDYVKWCRTHWPKAITEQAESYLRGVQHYQKEFERCIELGKRRFTGFLAPVAEHPTPGFGLCHPATLLRMMSPENAIAALRMFVTKYHSEIDLRNAFVVHEGDQWSEIVGLMPRENPCAPQAQFSRWIILTSAGPETNRYRDTLPQRKRINKIQSPSLLRMTYSRVAESFRPRAHPASQVLRSFRIIRELRESCGFVILQPNTNILPTLWDPFEAQKWASESEDFDARRDSIEPRDVETVARGWIVDDNPPQWIASDYRCIWTFNSLRVFVPVPQAQAFTESEQCLPLPLEFVTDVLNADWVDAFDIGSYLEKSLYIGDEKDGNRKSTYYHSLAILNRVSELYSCLGGSLVNLAVLSIPLWCVKWRPKYLDSLTIPEALACIATFASGQHNLQPSIFTDVIGISYGNTLYILEILLDDPWKCFKSDKLRESLCCLVGNVGNPGLSLLLSTREPMQNEPDLDSWNLINHNDFDGKLEDNFRGTALQLSLTGYTQSIDTEEHGTRDKDAFYVETVISIHDHGKWIGDVDILPMYRGYDGSTLDSSCAHSNDESGCFTDFGRVRSVDGWPEFTDPPLDACVIRAHDNWTARLALFAVSFARGNKMLVTSSKVCWACVSAEISRKGWSSSEVMVLC